MQRVNAEHGNDHCDVGSESDAEVEIAGGGVVRSLHGIQLVEDGRQDQERGCHHARYPAPFDLRRHDHTP